MSKLELNTGYETFIKNYLSKSNPAEWFVMYLKTHLTKNITLEDWNNVQKTLRNMSSDTKTFKEFLDIVYAVCLDVINNSGVKLDFNENTGNLSLINSAGEVIPGSSVDLPSELIIKDGRYNPEDKSIEFELLNGKILTIPVEDFIHSYKADEESLTLDLDTHTFKIKEDWLDSKLIPISDVEIDAMFDIEEV